MRDAMLLDITGWSPSELDQVDEVRLQHYLLWREVKATVQSNGEMRF